MTVPEGAATTTNALNLGNVSTTGTTATLTIPGAQTVATGTAATAAPTEPAATETTAQAASGLPDDPDALKAEIAKLRRENASSRTTAKNNAAEEARKALANELGKVLGLVNSDEPVDPAKLTQQLGEQQEAAQQARRDLAVYQLAGTLGADPNAVLDSYSFRMAVSKIDPTDSAAMGEAIKAAVAANPALAATPQRRLPASNPALGTSANGAPNAEALIAEAQKKGDWKTVIALQNQKLAEIKQ
jgi:hypothetical protein